jgi:hypothetical protein
MATVLYLVRRKKEIEVTGTDEEIMMNEITHN